LSDRFNVIPLTFEDHGLLFIRDLKKMHIVIIGNGISGITCARHIRKRSDHKITIVSAETDHFFSRTALMYIYMGHMKYEHTKPYEDGFWQKNRIELRRAFVEKIDTASKELLLKDGGSIDYDKLVIATGSKSNMFGWPGQDLPGVQGLYSYQDLETMEESTKNCQRAVIVGGGLIGVEMAEMLLTRNIQVTFLVREDHFWANVLPKEEGELVARHLIEHHVDLRLGAELKEIVAGPDGRAAKVITNTGEEIECQFVGLTAGVSPNIRFLEGSEIETQRGVLINEFFETGVPDVYSIGDCAQFHAHPDPERRPIEQVWYTGRMMGETLAKSLTGERSSYDPGVWFNSAKFFDIEYQTYGWVRGELGENEAQFYWEHKDGRMCLKMVWDKDSRKLKGINIFGIRFRHEICSHWFQNGVSVDHALEHFRDANFDPEFFRDHANEIVTQFNKEQGTTIQAAAKRSSAIFDRS